MAMIGSKSEVSLPRVRAGGLFHALVAGAVLAVGYLAAGTCSAAEAYRIGPGDQLRVEVGTRADITGQYLVSDTGTITVPVVGAVKAQGKTTDELAEDLSRRLSLIDRDIPNVTVTLVESRSQKIFVLGAVVLPGAYSFRALPTAWDAINQAGGPTPDAQLSAVEIIPGDLVGGRATKTVDIATVIREGRLESLDKLRPGDTVRVPRTGVGAGGAGDLVYVFGAVGAQGGIPISQAPDLMSALLRAGGPGAGADLGKVEIVRKDGDRLLHLRVDIGDYIRHSNSAGNVPLHPGDTVYLPARQPRVGSLFSVLGVVGPILALAGSIVALAR